MNAKRKGSLGSGLGRGLSNLLSETPREEEDLVQEVVSFEVPIDAIETNPYQPRTQFNDKSIEDLKQSIQVQGVIQPIALRKVGDKYQLISGERRLKASKLAGLKTIPAYIRDASDNQMLELGLIENIQRENLNPMEIALAYKRLIDECDLKQEELGSRVGKDRSTVNNYLRLLSLPEVVQEGLAEQKLTMGHARALLGLENKSQLLKLYKEVVEGALSVRKVEELVKKINNGVPKETPSVNKPVTIKSKKIVLDSYQRQFEAVFNKKVLVHTDESKKGEVKISYSSKAELEEIIQKLKK